MSTTDASNNNVPPPPVRYRKLMAECQQLQTKVAELESDKTEHQLVEETLKPLDGARRAYRLVGDVLVERTVAEVLPSITKNKENVSVPVVCELSGTAVNKQFSNICKPLFFISNLMMLFSSCFSWSQPYRLYRNGYLLIKRKLRILKQNIPIFNEYHT
jgi:chaperonin cofactor prefoldin